MSVCYVFKYKGMQTNFFVGEGVISWNKLNSTEILYGMLKFKAIEIIKTLDGLKLISI